MASEPAPLVQAKSIYDAAEPSDGYRVLATRYWPRGVSRGRCDEYTAALAPSRKLLHDFRAGEVDWDAYRERYLAELAGSEDAQERLGALRTKARDTTVTVM
ncbi:MAG TPA: DUF488 family protein, partial [Dehalococcoidia bacterium]|nr:DUF488 family protein [Dehalococcoidia bacterium]